MRRFLHKHRWTVHLVVALLLFATSGAMVTRMTCLIGGHTELTIGLAEECCPHQEHAGAAIGPQCCDIGQTDQLGSSFIGQAHLDLLGLFIALGSAPIITFTTPEPAPIAWLQSRPPPVDFGERSALSGSLRI